MNLSFGFDQRLSQRLSQRIGLDQLELDGGLTQTIFPRVFAWLNASTDHQEALERAASKKNADRYRSVIDFLFVETFTHFRAGCLAFYHNDGPPLREIIDGERLARFERALLSVLAVAYEAHCEDRRVSWGWVRDEGLARVAA